MDLCDICGDLKSTGFIQKLDCGHEFHYECILKSFKSSKDYLNSCPICRQHQNRLPKPEWLVSGGIPIWTEATIKDWAKSDDFVQARINKRAQTRLSK